MSYTYPQLKHIPNKVKENIAKIVAIESKQTFEAQGNVIITTNPQVSLSISIPATIKGFDINKYLVAGEFIKAEEKGGVNRFTITGVTNIANFIKNLGCDPSVYAILTSSPTSSLSRSTPAPVTEIAKLLPEKKPLAQSAPQQVQDTPQNTAVKPSEQTKQTSVMPIQAHSDTPTTPKFMKSEAEFAKEIAGKIFDFIKEYSEDHKSPICFWTSPSLPVYVKELQKTTQTYLDNLQKAYSMFAKGVVDKSDIHSRFRTDCYRHVQNGSFCKKDCLDPQVKEFYNKLNDEICARMNPISEQTFSSHRKL